MQDRWVKAFRRNGKVIKIKVHKARARVSDTAVRPAILYGASVIGMPPTAFNKDRANYACHHGRSPGMCSTTYIHIVNSRSDPAVQIPCATVDGLIKMWIRARVLYG